MLLLRERALKEKTAMELAWLEKLQTKQQCDRGCDDRRPEIIRQQKSIMKAHRRRKVGLHVAVLYIRYRHTHAGFMAGLPGKPHFRLLV